MSSLFIAWGTIAVLIIGVRIGHHFGHKDGVEEMQNPRRRELREVADWLDPELVRRRRQRVALTVSLIVIAAAASFWLQYRI